MFHVDNNSAVPVMPAVKPVVSAVTSFFTEGGNGVPPTYPGPDWFNIIQSELLAILAAAGISPDKASNVQLLAAMRVLFLDASQNGADIQDKAAFLQNLGLQNPDGSVGRLIGVRVFTISGIYNSSAGTKSVIVDAIGGGAGSGGVPATSSSQSGISAAGSSGSFARARYSSNFSGLQIQIGAGGVAGTSTTPGGDGGVTTFGSLLSCPGGKGSIAGIVSATQAVAAAPVQSLSPTGSNIIRASSGAPVNNAIQTAFGTASGWNPSAAGDGMFSDGLGGSGVYQGASKSAVNGNAGTRGIVVVWEYA